LLEAERQNFLPLSFGIWDFGAAKLTVGIFQGAGDEVWKKKKKKLCTVAWDRSDQVRTSRQGSSQQEGICLVAVPGLSQAVQLCKDGL
jgi:hypothetical protein